MPKTSTSTRTSKARKARKIPKIEFRDTNTVVREESSFQDFFIVVVLTFIILPICIYFLG